MSAVGYASDISTAPLAGEDDDKRRPLPRQLRLIDRIRRDPRWEEARRAAVQ